MKVYVVIHNFISHDMFVPEWSKIGEPKVFGVFSTKAKAQKHVRPTADDYIRVFTLDANKGLDK